MDPEQELIELEEHGWQALSAGGEAAVAFYRDVLADDAVMIFPGGMLMKGKERILETTSGPPWEWYELNDLQVIALSADTQAVTYQATAQRPRSDVYRALISSIYVHSGEGWRLVLHQQSAR